jgi:hypothetical protein
VAGACSRLLLSVDEASYVMPAACSGRTTAHAPARHVLQRSRHPQRCPCNAAHAARKNRAPPPCAEAGVTAASPGISSGRRCTVLKFARRIALRAFKYRMAPVGRWRVTVTVRRFCEDRHSPRLDPGLIQRFTRGAVTRQRARLLLHDLLQLLAVLQPLGCLRLRSRRSRGCQARAA